MNWIRNSKEEPKLTREQEKQKEKEMAAYFEEYEKENRPETLSEIHQRVSWYGEMIIYSWKNKRKKIENQKINILEMHFLRILEEKEITKMLTLFKIKAHWKVGLEL